MSSRLAPDVRERTSPDELASAAASRLRRRRWRDPRLWLGVALVMASVVVGAKLLAAADDTVPVWSLRSDGVAGTEIGPDDVRIVDVHFSDTDDTYLLASASFPTGLSLVRDVGAGELIPVAATSADTSGLPDQLPLGIETAGLPNDLASGDRVRVWAVPDGAKGGPPVEVLDLATVVSVEQSSSTGVGSQRRVLVTLPAGADLVDVLGALRDATVILIRRGG